MASTISRKDGFGSSLSDDRLLEFCRQCVGQVRRLPVPNPFFRLDLIGAGFHQFADPSCVARRSIVCPCGPRRHSPYPAGSDRAPTEPRVYRVQRRHQLLGLDRIDGWEKVTRRIRRHL